MIDRILAQLADSMEPGTALNADALREQLLLIRQRGYAIGDSEIEVGTRSISVPVLTRHHRRLGCLTAAGPSTRPPSRRPRELLVALEQTAEHIIEEWRDETWSRHDCSDPRSTAGQPRPESEVTR